MKTHHQAEHLFKGAFAEEYQFLNRICPLAAVMSQRVGDVVGHWPARSDGQPLSVLELGCGTGITTHCLLQSRPDIQVHAIDNAPAMLNQARAALAEAVRGGRLRIEENDALNALRSLPDASIDLVVSAYTLHNLLYGYRHQVLAEVFRVLKPGGAFVNGDRYALDDPAAHLAITQGELSGYFRILLEDMQRPDLLEQWVLHHFSDESEEHIMRLGKALDEMAAIGFQDVRFNHREGVNALVTGVKPWR